MKMIFGLGNPGLKYSVTRHNCGFMTLDKIADELGCSFGRKEMDNDIASAVYKGQKIILAKPQSYMNLSGFPLSRLCGYYKVDYSDVLVIHDDLSLEPGKLRLRRGGSDGCHNGIKSIIEQTGTRNINRLKIGIGEAPFGNTVEFVLAPFSRDDMAFFAAAFARAAEAALCWADEGIDVAMNKYNRNEAL